MESNKQKPHSTNSRGKVWASVVTTALGVVASLISSIVASADILKNVSKEYGLAFAAAVFTVAISAGFTSIIARRERGPSQIAKIKDDLSSAYLESLDASPLNPVQGGSR